MGLNNTKRIACDGHLMDQTEYEEVANEIVRDLWKFTLLRTLAIGVTLLIAIVGVMS